MVATMARSLLAGGTPIVGGGWCSCIWGPGPEPSDAPVEAVSDDGDGVSAGAEGVLEARVG
ncbi:hypothetical protein DEI83_11595 [Curtobacterium sp. MCBD17_021]|nr:hypothetical protein DEI83_11595 [Curtobacterium sp. MCBD17_021]